MEHRGEIVEKAVRNKLSISELSRRLQVSRRTIYNWFDKSELSFHTINAIGTALDYDFSSEFPQLPKRTSSGKVRERRHVPSPLDEVLKDDVNFWREKYSSLLELHTSMLENQGFQMRR